MIDFVLPNSRARLPTFRTNCPDRSHFAQMGSYLAQNTTTNPCSLLPAVTNPFRGHVHTQNTPKPTPKHPFSWPELEGGENVQQSGQNGPQLGKINLKSGQKFLEVGNKFIHNKSLNSF